MKRIVRMAAYALALTLVMSGWALARDDDDDDHGYYRGGNGYQAQQYGYQNGYRDGVRQGRHEGRENDPNDYQTPDWRQATRGYEDWMGPVNLYQRGYQNGYRNGFRSGFNSINHRWGDGDGDRDDRPYGGWRGGYDPNYGNVAYRFGYEDGAQVAREDNEHGKRYNSKPRGRYDDRDRGYRREYGSKDQYKSEYTAGYRAGYDASYRSY